MKNNYKLIRVESDKDMKKPAGYTTIALQQETKKRLDGNRTYGQCYDSFINDLVGCWERYRIYTSLCGPDKPVNQAVER